VESGLRRYPSVSNTSTVTGHCTFNPMLLMSESQQMSMQVQWRRVFTIVFGALIWAATVAFLEIWIGFLVFRIAGGAKNDLTGFAVTGGCFLAFPLIAIAAVPIASFASGKVMPPDRRRPNT
jgi:hypothetical protein